MFDHEQLAALETENTALRRRVAQLEHQLHRLEQDAASQSQNPSLPFQEIFDELPVPIVLYRPDGTAVAINRHNERLIGVPCTSIVDKHNIFADPEAVTKGYAACFEMACNGAVVKMPPTPYDTAKAQLDDQIEGRQFWSETTYFPIYNASGLPMYIGEVNQDVTERMQAEAEQQRLTAVLQERERRFRGLFDSAPIGIALLSPVGVLLEYNTALHTMFGRTADQLCGMTFVDVTHPDDVTIDQGYYEELLEGKRESYQIEKRYIHASGQEIVGRLTVSLVRAPSGAIEFVVAMLEDITARHQAEHALQANQAFLQAVLEHVPSVVYAKDEAGRYILVNRQLERVLQRPRTEIQGKTDDELYPLGQARRYQAADQQVLNTGIVLEQEDQTYLPDRQLHTFVTVKFPLYDEAGSRYAVCGISTDVTARKRAEAERLQIERKMLETQKLESLGVLAGGVAHDFNNLLMAVLGNAALALDDLPSTSAARTSIENIKLAARRASDLTRQMLAYAGKSRLVVHKVDLNNLVQEIIQLLQASIAKNVVLRYIPAPLLPSVQADATQLRQIIMNLVVNAAEAIGTQSGVVTITTGSASANDLYRPHPVIAPDVLNDQYIFLRVTDTGIGMDEATRTKIFDPFFTTKFTGRGLGLAAVLGIVRGHKGALSVQSIPHHGATFTVYLPSSTSSVAPSQEMFTVRNSWTGSSSVLIIDDEPGVLNIAVRMLERLGLRVLSAPDGQAGVASFRAHASDIDCVLLDLMMPRLSGIDVFHLLRAIKPNVPVILMSGYNEHDTAEQIAGLDLAGYLSKPFTPHDLSNVLQTVLGAEPPLPNS